MHNAIVYTDQFIINKICMSKLPCHFIWKHYQEESKLKFISEKVHMDMNAD